MTWTVMAIVLATMTAASAEEQAPSAPKPGETKRFDATAYSRRGRTAGGTPARPGVVAADPKVLPLGSEIKVDGAGEHSGKYVVEDTGPAIQGRTIDVFVPKKGQAKKFGRKQVEVKVLKRGVGRGGAPAGARR